MSYAPSNSMKAQAGIQKVFAIAASTGGPQAVLQVLSQIPTDCPGPILVVQHLATGLVEGFAQWLDQQLAIEVAVAVHVEPLRPGRVYVAPEERHLGVNRDGRVELLDLPPRDGFRPSATVLFESVARSFGENVIAVILTGLGSDGVEGLEAVRQTGGSVISRNIIDEITAAVAQENQRLMPIVVRSRRKKPENILAEFPGAEIIDVTSKGQDPWVKFSPFYPHYDIPVPLWEGKAGACVEAIWQALKVFESTDVDEKMLGNDTMKNIKRTVRRFGRVLGHRRIDTGELVPYVEARKLIYLPAYRFVLEKKLQDELRELEVLATRGTVVLLDYETNEDVNDTRKPLSHAGLVVACLRGQWPA